MSTVLVVEHIDHYEHNRAELMFVCADIESVKRATRTEHEDWRLGTDKVWEVVVPGTNELSSFRATPREVLTPASTIPNNIYTEENS